MLELQIYVSSTFYRVLSCFSQFKCLISPLYFQQNFLLFLPCVFLVVFLYCSILFIFFFGFMQMFYSFPKFKRFTPESCFNVPPKDVDQRNRKQKLTPAHVFATLRSLKNFSKSLTYHTCFQICEIVLQFFVFFLSFEFFSILFSQFLIFFLKFSQFL